MSCAEAHKVCLKYFFALIGFTKFQSEMPEITLFQSLQKIYKSFESHVHVEMLPLNAVLVVVESK